MMDLLAKLRRAPLVDPYSGPAILSGRAAGVFFHEIFGHRVEGSRQRNADDGQTFGAKINESVLPSFLSVIFDPTLQDARKRRAHRALRLRRRRACRRAGSRWSTRGCSRRFCSDGRRSSRLLQSNGHGRGEAGAVPVSRQSNLIVESTRTVSSAALVTMLKEEAKRQGKPFGLLFDNIEGGFTVTGRSNPNAFNVMPNIVYRIYTDDRAPELVRGVDLDRHAAGRLRQVHRRERQDRCLQRRVRRRERQRSGIRVVSGAARQRSRGAEEGAVAGDRCRSCRRRRDRIAPGRTF